MATTKETDLKPAGVPTQHTSVQLMRASKRLTNSAIKALDQAGGEVESLSDIAAAINHLQAAARILENPPFPPS